jgi:hypothetical protein
MTFPGATVVVGVFMHPNHKNEQRPLVIGDMRNLHGLFMSC